jgi:hypothetical protein
MQLVRASRLLAHFRDGSGEDFALTKSDIKKIVGTEKAQAQMRAADEEFKAALKKGQNGYSVYKTNDFTIEYFKPSSKWDRSADADLFYSFHNLYMKVTYSGDGWFNGEGDKKYWKGKVTYHFHDTYAFANRNWQAIPGDTDATDFIFWVWQEYGDARSFDVAGDHVEMKRFCVDVDSPDKAGKPSGSSGGYGSGY